MMRLTLRSLREIRNLTIKQVSEAVEISIWRLQRWEVDSHSVRFSKAVRLCNYYNISMDLIFWGKESEALKNMQDYLDSRLERKQA